MSDAGNGWEPKSPSDLITAHCETLEAYEYQSSVRKRTGKEAFIAGSIHLLRLQASQLVSVHAMVAKWCGC